MAKIAILGFGTIGSGVYEVLRGNAGLIKQKAGQEISVKYVLDKRRLDDSAVRKLAVENFDVIAADDDVAVVVETMGGLEPAFTFARRALSAGKAFVTSNKELVARHGQELSALAAENSTNFFFEASAAGGIPVLRAISEALTSDRLTGVTGVINGTTNYILSKMAAEGNGFEDALQKAQELGYAEANPSADIDGYDTCRKLAILLSLTTGKLVNYEDIPTTGIKGISAPEMIYAKLLNCTVRLLAMAEITGEGAIAQVAPAMIPGASQLSGVDGIYNAVIVRGDMLGDVMFYGPGAGKLSTATAVAADVIAAVRSRGICVSPRWSAEPLRLLPIDKQIVQVFVRLKYTNRQNAVLAVLKVFGGVEVIESPLLPDEFAFVTRPEAYAELETKINMLMYNNGVSQIPSRILLKGI